MDLQFSGRTAIVTGAASGIGLATAREFGARGARVFFIDRNAPGLETLAAEFASAGWQGRPLTGDIADAADVARLTALIAAENPEINVLAHCAGIQRYGTAVSTPEQVWDETMSVNAKSGYLLSQAILPRMTNGGAVVMVGSVQSVAAAPNSAAYVTSKHALLGLTRSIAIDFASQGIRAICVCPGAIDTPMLRKSMEETGHFEQARAGAENLHLLRRLGTPEEVAKAIVFLASDDASFITGSPIFVDGGLMTPAGGASNQGLGR